MRVFSPPQVTSETVTADPINAAAGNPASVASPAPANPIRQVTATRRSGSRKMRGSSRMISVP